MLLTSGLCRAVPVTGHATAAVPKRLLREWDDSATVTLPRGQRDLEEGGSGSDEVGLNRDPSTGT